MRRIFTTMTLTVVLSGIVGCAHYHVVDEPVKNSENIDGVKVGIGSKEVKEGDKVSVNRRICEKKFVPKRGLTEICNDEKIGEALVMKVLDEESAIVRPNPGLQMDKSMIVEKL